MTVRYFLIVEDLKSVEGDKWRSNVMIKGYVSSLDTLNNEDKETQNKKRIHFFCYVSESLNNYFKQWTNNLLFLSLFSSQNTATIVAKMIIGTIVNTAQSYYC